MFEFVYGREDKLFLETLSKVLETFEPHRPDKLLRYSLSVNPYGAGLVLIIIHIKKHNVLFATVEH